MQKDQRIELRNKLFNIFVNLSIINIKNNHNTINKKKLFTVLNNNKDINDNYNTYIKEFRTEIEGMYCLIHNTDISEHLCKNCKELVEFKNYCYKKTCGKKECLSALIKKSREKAKQTCIERYGVSNPAKSKDIINKMKATNLKKYGKEYVVQTDDFKRKSEKTCIEKYGVKNAMQSEEIKEKLKQTILETYGREQFLQGKEIHEVIKQTCIEKYGVEYPMQNKDILNKAMQTNLKRYNVKTPMESEQLKENFRKSYIKNNYSDSFNNDELKTILNDKFNNITIEEVYSNNEYFTQLIIYMSKFKNRKLRLKEVSNLFNVHPTTIKVRIESLNLLDYFYIREIELEVKFRDFLIKNNIGCGKKSKSILNNEKEIDFLFEEYGIGFEINDLASHNINSKKEDYHIKKTEESNKNKYRLIHIWEWELVDEILWKRLSNWILNLLNDNKIKISASKCKCKLVTQKEEQEFLNNYHLQGYIKSDICIGLYYKNELIQLMSFGKPRYNKNYEYELLRLCTKYGYNIIKGSVRLLEHFKNQYNPKSIISYCDISKFDGSVYIKLGFKLLKRTSPSAIWYNPDTEDKFLNSSLVMKGADKLIGTNYGKGTNNEKIAYISGYKKVYNCGLDIYELKLS